MLSSFSSPLNSIPDIPGIISVVTAGIISVVGIILVVIGGHFGGGVQFEGGEHFCGGTGPLSVARSEIMIKYKNTVEALVSSQPQEGKLELATYKM